ncbi:MAG: EscU/YscU/HrcU family type III secretion system export apparatus switch protein [Halanaerobiaceae bacterium]
MAREKNSNSIKKQKTKNKLKRAAALKYNKKKDSAPRLIAKGTGDIADRIIKTAEKNDIPIREDEDIIRVLMQMDIDDEIPEDLYRVIAEILSFIYLLDEN